MPKVQKGKKFILFLPEDEFHELTLLMTQYVLKDMGYQTLYLGSNVPVKDLTPLIKGYEADYVFGIFTSDLNGKHQDYLNALLDKVDSNKLVLSGRLIVDKILKYPKTIKVIKQIKGISRL